MTITSVPGIRVGQWSDREGLTGVTVVVPPEPNVTAVEVRGAAPGTRETALLAPGMKVEGVHAIVLCGGSAFGLAAASGVAEALEQDGKGFPTLAGNWSRSSRLPSSSILRSGATRPGPDPMTVPPPTGPPLPNPSRWARSVRAPAPRSPGGGVSSTSAREGSVRPRPLIGDAVIGALAVVNAVGDVFTLEGEALTGGDLVPGPPPFAPSPMENTTLVVLATDGGLRPFGAAAPDRPLSRCPGRLSCARGTLDMMATLSLPFRAGIEWSIPIRPVRRPFPWWGGPSRLPSAVPRPQEAFGPWRTVDERVGTGTGGTGRRGLHLHEVRAGRDPYPGGVRCMDRRPRR